MKKPDVKAPRFRHKSVKILNKDFYNHLRNLYPDLKYTDKEISKIIKDFNKSLADKIISTRDGVKLPVNLGVIAAVAVPYKGLNIVDYPSSIKYGTKVYFRNNQTEGMIGKIKYFTSFAMYKARFYYGFRLCREKKREFAKLFKENFAYYKINENFKYERLKYKKEIRDEIINSGRFIKDSDSSED